MYGLRICSYKCNLRMVIYVDTTRLTGKYSNALLVACSCERIRIVGCVPCLNTECGSRHEKGTR